MSPTTSVPEGYRVEFRSLIPLLLISFGIAWGILGLYIFLPELMEKAFGRLTGNHPLFFLAVYAPAIAAFTLVARNGGIPGLRRFLGRALLWRCSAAWYAFLILAAIKGPVEEFGWRGLALPLLQSKFAPIWAGLILGAIWGLWHLPAFLLSGTRRSEWSFAAFFAGCLAISVIATAQFQ